MKAIAIIQDEHRAIAAIVQALRHIVAEIDAGRMAPDHAMLGALFDYIEQFPERLHHPKEDDFLFARLRVRRPDTAPLLDSLTHEHAIGRDRFAELKAAWERFREDPRARKPFVERVERYAQTQWLHMRREEDDVLPLAEVVLTPDDWESIDAAFASNDNPVVGVPASKAFRELFRRVAAIVPPPYGVGPEPRTSR